MNKKPVPKMAGLVSRRLLRLSKDRGEDFNHVLIRYGLERLLYRIGQSPHEGAFVLKGAMLFASWSGHPHRATKDLDLCGSGAPEIERVVEVFREIVGVPVDDDGLAFDPENVAAERIKEGAEYEGVRVTLRASLGTAKLTLQVDVGFGDAVTPAPMTIDYPTLLDLPCPRLRAYPKETVISEKVQAMVQLGLANSRMKDFFDIGFLAGAFEFDGGLLRQAVVATFERRGTAIPEGLPLALTEAFFTDLKKRQQWAAFIGRSGVVDKSLALDQVVGTLAGFLGPVLDAARTARDFAGTWPPGGPWAPRLGLPG